MLILLLMIHFASKFYDIIRIDHFRAFDSYWSINPSCLTAIDGEWKYPNGYLFFDTLYRKYPETKIIAEDLGGDLRQEVYSLRDHYNFPGMRVLEFSIFDDEIRLPFAGTSLYMAPEILNPERKYIKVKECSKIDMFSIGILLYHLAFNEYPYNLQFEDRKNFEKIGEKIHRDILVLF